MKFGAYETCYVNGGAYSRCIMGYLDPVLAKLMMSDPFNILVRSVKDQNHLEIGNWHTCSYTSGEAEDLRKAWDAWQKAPPKEKLKGVKLPPNGLRTWTFTPAPTPDGRLHAKLVTPEEFQGGTDRKMITPEEYKEVMQAIA